MATLILAGRVAEIPAGTLRPLLGSAGPVTLPVVYCAGCGTQLVTDWFAGGVDTAGPVALLCLWCAPGWTAGDVARVVEPASTEPAGWCGHCGRQVGACIKSGCWDGYVPGTAGPAEAEHLAVTDTRAADHTWRSAERAG